MFGKKHREQEAEELARAQAAEAVEASEVDDLSVDPDEQLEEELEPDDIPDR